MAAFDINPTVHRVDDDTDLRVGLPWPLDSRGLPARGWTGGDAFLQALAALGAREREVPEDPLQGCYNMTIAAPLGIARRTVEFHRTNVFEKLKLQSAAEPAHRMVRLIAGAID